MSFTKTTLGQTDHLAPSCKDAGISAPNDQRCPGLFSRLKPAPGLNIFYENSTTSSNLKPNAGSSPACLSTPRTYPPATSHSNNERPPSLLQSDAQKQKQIAAPSSARIPYSEFERDYGDIDLESLPAGFPYNGWYGVWCFACEYVRSMQGLVTERLEGRGKYGIVRRTT